MRDTDTDTITFDLPWPLICRLACEAMIERMTFEELVVEALQERMERWDRERGAQQRRKGKR